ncbi:MAG: glycosyltransferase [Pseudomonadota bacterium]
MRVLILSNRAPVTSLAEACAFDLEDAFADAVGAEIWPVRDRAAEPTRRDYDLVIAAGTSYLEVEDALRLAGTARRGALTVGYLFGAYASVLTKTRPPRPYSRRLRPKLWWLKRLDHLFVGMRENVDLLAGALGVPVTYVPMAANVKAVAARPFGARADRPISVAGYGRQHPAFASALGRRLNAPGSGELFYHTNWYRSGAVTDRARYREMFWQILRQSRVALAFDHLFADPGQRGELSYVGPRWFESLAAGCVIAGVAPRTDEARRLLDWTDATVELPEEAEAGAEALIALLADEDRLRAASAETLRQMRLRHDWRHRLRDMLEALGMDAAPVAPAIAALADQARAGAA